MIELIQQRLEKYRVEGIEQQEQALKEILQELILYGLWRQDFFKVAAFQGDTSLRILYGLPRFSEDLDFILQSPNLNFTWAPVLKELAQILSEFGVQAEILDRTRADRPVKEAMLKDDSLGSQLNLMFLDWPQIRKLRIKLEVDSQPPVGSGWDQKFHDFPTDFSVTVQDLSSNFALKLHALLCRRYIKGRDWFDLLWYIRNGTKPNLALLQNALQQSGPFAKDNLAINAAWLRQALLDKIQQLNWDDVKRDVEPFLNALERRSLAVWGAPLFIERVHQLCDQM